MNRREELAGRLAVVRQRIERACVAADRDPDGVRLIVVTKFFPASDVRLLAELGVTDVGENRHQEAEEKHAECADLDLTWHFIGGLQSNKAAAVASYADVVQSVDSAKLVTRLARAAEARGRPLDVLLQVSLDREAVPGSGRHGIHPDEIWPRVEQVLELDTLRLKGVMGVAPLGLDPAPAFARLAGIAAQVRAEAPGATWISAGMSGDLEQAVEAGATHLRIGSAVLGSRV